MILEFEARGPRSLKLSGTECGEGAEKGGGQGLVRMLSGASTGDADRSQKGTVGSSGYVL